MPIALKVVIFSLPAIVSGLFVCNNIIVRKILLDSAFQTFVILSGVSYGLHHSHELSSARKTMPSLFRRCHDKQKKRKQRHPFGPVVNETK